MDPQGLQAQLPRSAALAGRLAPEAEAHSCTEQSTFEESSTSPVRAGSARNLFQRFSDSQLARTKRSGHGTHKAIGRCAVSAMERRPSQPMASRMITRALHRLLPQNTSSLLGPI
jgi:hypothetical protein